MKTIRIILLTLLFTLIIYPQQKYGSELQLHLAAPVGSYAKYFNVGFGVTGGFYYHLEENLRLGLSLGYIKIGADAADIEEYYRTTVSSGDLNMTGFVGVIPLLITFKMVSPGRKYKVYGSIDGGLYTYWTKAAGDFTNNGATSSIDKSEFRSEPGISFGIGSLLKMGETLWLDFNFKYHLVQNSEYINADPEYEAISTSKMIIVGVGLNWNFESGTEE